MVGLRLNETKSELEPVQDIKFPQFMALVPEPRALAMDALSQDWQGRSM